MYTYVLVWVHKCVHCARKLIFKNIYIDTAIMIKFKLIEKQLTNERILFQCKSCTYIGPTANAVENHVKIVHQGLFLQCQECDYSSRDSSNMKKHTERHNEKCFKCEYCNIKFGGFATLNVHVKSQHGGLELKCKDCIYKTNRKRSF